MKDRHEIKGVTSLEWVVAWMRSDIYDYIEIIWPTICVLQSSRNLAYFVRSSRVHFFLHHTCLSYKIYIAIGLTLKCINLETYDTIKCFIFINIYYNRSYIRLKNKRKYVYRLVLYFYTMIPINMVVMFINIVTSYKKQMIEYL